MGTLTDYPSHDATELARLVAADEVTPLELVEHAIERIETLNPDLNAIVYPLYDAARARAKDGLPDGPFKGVPIVLKDHDTALAGVPMTHGSRIYRNFRPARSSVTVERLLAAGVIVVGKTNTPELGILPTTEPEANGPTRNPWNRELSAGGSSGGTAAAIASGMVPWGTGGDGGGSLRIPASCCGLFGLKPTRGRVPVGPDQGEAWAGFSIPFGMSKTVRDSAAMLDVVAGPSPGDWHQLPAPDVSFLEAAGRDPGRLRIAFSAEPFLPGEMHADCRAGLKATVKKLEDLGHELVEARPTLDGATFARRFLTVLAGQIRAAIEEAGEDVGRPVRRRDFEERTWLIKVLGDNLSAGEYAHAVRGLQRQVLAVHAFFDDYDVYLCPTLGAPPGKLGFLDAHGLPAIAEKLAGRLPIGPLLTSRSLLEQASAETFAFIPNTPVFNVSGQPSMSLPLHSNDAGVPVGMMFSGRFGDEATLFRLAAQLEMAHPWADRLPLGA
jgi:amidase